MLSQRTEEKAAVIGSLGQKLKDYVLLTKVRLSSLVIFSSAIGYLVAPHTMIDWGKICWLLLGGFLTTAGSNALNQVIEKDYDKLMSRTADRPLPTGRMSVTEALLAAGICGVGGVLVLWYNFNVLTAFISAVALLSYAFIYTPLKRISPIAVFVGAIPGALPPVIGWVAATGSISQEAIILFAIQFIWQFPHFWAIAWVCYDDYKKAGFKLLPSKEGRNKFSALQNIIYILVLIPVSIIPMSMNMTGWIPTTFVLFAGVLFLIPAIRLYRECSMKAAKQLMFTSFIYLPIVQLALLMK